MIKLKNLYKSYGDFDVLEDISFQVNKEEVLALIGFSGCGKSTVLKIIAGLEPYESGEVILSSDKLGMCFQYSALFDSMTVFENIAFALRNTEQVLEEGEIRGKVLRKLSLVGLSGTEDAYPSELSGGMKKRVAFARAIVDDPEIILYDEPTAGLDPVASTIIEDLILKLQKEVQAAAVLVTHQRSTIERAADKVCMLYNRQIVWEGTPKELFDPANDNQFAKQFRLGSVQGPMAVKV